jgi:hypothetical protein
LGGRPEVVPVRREDADQVVVAGRACRYAQDRQRGPMSITRQMRRAQERAEAKHGAKRPRAIPQDIERLVAAALIRDGAVESRGFKEHWRIRAALGDANPYDKNPADEHGFLTSTGRFVSRREAMKIGAAAGQCVIMGRELLSSDIDW